MTITMALVVMIIGMIGTVLPVVPGIPLIWVAMFVFSLVEGFDRVGVVFLGVSLMLVVAAEVADYGARAWGARQFGAGKAGVWGAVIGAVIGLFFLPLGLVLGPFFGAFFGEWLAGRTMSDSMLAGLGGLIGTLGSIGVKFVIAMGMTIAFAIKVL